MDSHIRCHMSSVTEQPGNAFAFRLPLHASKAACSQLNRFSGPVIVHGVRPSGGGLVAQRKVRVVRAYGTKLNKLEVIQKCSSYFGRNIESLQASCLFEQINQRDMCVSAWHFSSPDSLVLGHN